MPDVLEMHLCFTHYTCQVDFHLAHLQLPPRSTLTQAGVVAIQRYLRDKLSIEHHDERLYIL